MTKKFVAKTVLRQTVAISTAKATEAALSEYTEINTDSTTAQIGTMAFGQYVAYKLSPVTNAIVDTTASRYARLKAKTKTAKEVETPTA
jgi:hypothetical protein